MECSRLNSVTVPLDVFCLHAGKIKSSVPQFSQKAREYYMLAIGGWRLVAIGG